ncbi:hypothetical protein, partial [Paratractidigestivibacter sp.]|uniref:hypothetical protein n=1 Tax=Paratractidigestivibacter sp. TaxID=2847316 RepID=UPI003A914FFD
SWSRVTLIWAMPVPPSLFVLWRLQMLPGGRASGPPLLFTPLYGRSCDFFAFGPTTADFFASAPTTAEICASVALRTNNCRYFCICRVAYQQVPISLHFCS